MIDCTCIICSVGPDITQLVGVLIVAKQIWLDKYGCTASVSSCTLNMLPSLIESMSSARDMISDNASSSDITPAMQAQAYSPRL
ncbi:hypothetical protein D3C74_199600 [compost metagenome]